MSMAVLCQLFRAYRLRLREAASALSQLFRCNPVTLRVTNERKVIQAADVATGFLQAALELACRRLILTLPLMNNAEVVMRHHVLGGQRQRKFEVLMSLIELAVVEQGEGEAIMSCVVVGVDFKAAAVAPHGARHVTAMVVGDTKIIVSESETGSCRYRLLVISRGLFKQPVMKVERAEQMVSEHVLGLCCQQAFELAAGLLAASFPFVDHG